MSKITTLRQAVASNSYFPTRMNRSSQLGKRTSLPFAFTMALTLLLSLVRVGDVWGQSFAIVGNGTGSNTTSTYPAPYGNYYYGARHQFLITAAELTAAGVASGSSISSLGFNVSTDNGSTVHNGFQVIVYSTTSANPLNTDYVTTGQVAASSSSNYNPTTGWNQHSFTAFAWNGTDNLVIQTCFNNRRIDSL